ncbi:GNAT family N-acetyltransferase [Hydrogenophaga sp. OTU3427]|uniref:GNAT family N-acetyltransferase n=1 Tax=Hydrogenophaga sp. OTU3427 TaxID=3043856 RepID=UPI00313E1B9F
MSLRWTFQPFDALKVHGLYALLRLRSEVFVVEQQCLFLDLDNSDQDARHLLGWRDSAGSTGLVAAARCFGPGVKYAEASIGRVVTAPDARGGGLGHELMREARRALYGHWGRVPIRIGAQARLQAFYEQHGFAQSGEPYIEDGIPHIEMLCPATHGEPHAE